MRLDTVLQDVRFAARMIRRNPTLAIIAMLTMALGIGANTAIFSVVEAALLKPLNYERPSELALIWSDFQKTGAKRAPAAGFELQEIRTRSNLFQDVAGIWVGNGTFTDEGEPEQFKLGSVTVNFFSVLGVKPAAGRIFDPEDEAQAPNQPIPSIILSYGLWQRRFGGSRDIIGQSIELDTFKVTVVGVLPADFKLTFPPDANVPANVEAYVPFPKTIYDDKTSYYLRVLGRLKPGVTIEQAQQEADAIARQLRNEIIEYGAENLQLKVIGLHDDIISDIKPALLALLIGAGLVLLISCFNVANLLLTRANARRKEIALRVALGASRWRISRQLLIESLTLCSLAGMLGLVTGWLGLDLLFVIYPDSLARVGEINLNLTILGFVSFVSLSSGVLAGLAPVFETRKVNLIETLKEEGRSSAGQSRSRVRAFLIVTEIVLGCVLLVGAGLLIRTMMELQKVNPGFNPENVLTFEINFGAGYRTAQDRLQFVNQFEEKLSAIAEAEAAGAISHLPLDDYPTWYSPYAPEGLHESERQSLTSDYRAITDGFFQAMGTRLIAGRYFNSLDGAANRKVVIVDETLARQTWPGENAVGKLIEAEPFPNAPSVLAEVVGVVEHIRNYNLSKTVRGQIYWPFAQCSHWHLSYAVKVKGDPFQIAATVRRELDEIDKNMAIAKVRPIEHYVSKAMASTTFTAALAGVFALLALVLASVGIYGVVSYSVGQRAHEIGVRMALGASPANILGLIMKEGLMLTGAGLALGMIASLALSRFLQGMMFGVTALDPVTYLVMATAIITATIFACWRPASRAASGSAMDALRKNY